MKIKLSDKKWRQVIDALNASEDIDLSAKAKPIERVIGKIKRALKPETIIIDHQYGWLGASMLAGMARFDTEIEFSADDVEVIIEALNESIEAKRDEIDDDIIDIEPNDSDNTIEDIIEDLSDSLNKAKEAKEIESIRESIEKQRDESKENEKDQKIAELTAKVDAQQMALKGKDGEIESLRSRKKSADHYIYELECRLGRRCPDPIYYHGRPIDIRCRF